MPAGGSGDVSSSPGITADHSGTAELVHAALLASELMHATDSELLLGMHRVLHAVVKPNSLTAAFKAASPAALQPLLPGSASEPAAAAGEGVAPDTASSASSSPGNEALLSAVILSQRIVECAVQLPYLPPPTVLDVLVDHGLLCGLAAYPDRGVAAWAAAADLSQRFNALSSPLHELYESFARKPPRTPAEAAVAYRMRAVTAENTAS